MSIGAQNKNWFKMWQTALSQAKVLIQVQTKEYFDNKACAQEMGVILKELDETGNNLEVLAFTVDGTLPQMAIGPAAHDAEAVCQGSRNHRSVQSAPTPEGLLGDQQR